MSTKTKFLKLHKWELPSDEKQIVDYKKSIADAYDIIDEFAENSDSRMADTDKSIQELEQKYKKEIENIENLVPIRTSTRRRNYIKR